MKKLFLAFIISSTLFSGCISEISGNYTDNLSYEHQQVRMSDRYAWCGSDVDGYCHEIEFNLTNNNIGWTFVSKDGNWTVLTDYDNTYNEENVNGCEVYPGGTCINWRLKFPVPENERITKLFWDSGDLHFEVDIPPY